MESVFTLIVLTLFTLNGNEKRTVLRRQVVLAGAAFLLVGGIGESLFMEGSFAVSIVLLAIVCAGMLGMLS